MFLLKLMSYCKYSAVFGVFVSQSDSKFCADVSTQIHTKLQLKWRSKETFGKQDMFLTFILRKCDYYGCFYYIFKLGMKCILIMKLQKTEWPTKAS